MERNSSIHREQKISSRSSSESSNNLSISPSNKDQKIRTSSKIATIKNPQSKPNLLTFNAEETKKPNLIPKKESFAPIPHFQSKLAINFNDIFNRVPAMKRSKLSCNRIKKPDFIKTQKLSLKKKNCYICDMLIEKEYKTPRCTKHEYCIDCVKQCKNSIKCDYCSMYFESLTRSASPDSLKCTLCRIYPDINENKCEVHSYCRYCFEFLHSNDFGHIVIPTSCQDCSASLKLLKAKNIIKPSISKFENTLPIVKIKETQEVDLPVVIPNDTTEILEIKQLDAKYTTPRCTEHHYCEVCIKSSQNKILCYFCSMYFESLTRIHNQYILICSLCKLVPMNSGVKCKVHSYCEYCFKYLTENDCDHLVNVANCEECREFLKDFKKNSEGLSILNLETGQILFNNAKDYSSRDIATATFGKKREILAFQK